MTLLFKLFIL